MIGIDTENILLSDGDTFSFKVFMSEDDFIITAPKVGTRFMLQLFKKNEVDFNIKSKIHSISDLKSKTNKIKTSGEYDIEYDREVYENAIIEEWDKIIDKTSKKNIVVLYRHPIERFKSAVIQDFAGALSENRYNGLFFQKELLISDGGFSEQQAMQFLTQFCHSLYENTGMGLQGNDEYLKMYDEMKPLFEYMLEVYLKHTVIHGTHHYSDYLNVFYTLKNIGVFKDIKFINIDTKGVLEDYFKDILEGSTNIPQKFSNNLNGKKILDDILIKNNLIQKRLHSKLKDDLIIYSVLNTKFDAI